jgi:hypothetical protein
VLATVPEIQAGFGLSPAGYLSTKLTPSIAGQEYISLALPILFILPYPPLHKVFCAAFDLLLCLRNQHLNLVA